jgi:hypothetical protein
MHFCKRSLTIKYEISLATGFPSLSLQDIHIIGFVAFRKKYLSSGDQVLNGIEQAPDSMLLATS